MDEEIYALDRNGNKLFSVSIENPKLFYLVGLPASGKSTKAKELSKIYNAKIHSSDSIREELGDIDNQDNNDLVFRILHNRIFTDLMDGNSVIYDATNIRKKHRIHFLQLLESKKIACKKICFITAKPYERCLIHNIMRHKSVPFEVIKNM